MRSNDIKHLKLLNIIVNVSFSIQGFREKDSGSSPSRNSGLKVSNESLSKTSAGNHSRTYSDGGSSTGSNNNSGYPPPPSGPRVVLGRETTPTMGGGSYQNIANSKYGENNNKIPKEVWDRFEGKSREVSCCYSSW